MTSFTRQKVSYTFTVHNRSNNRDTFTGEKLNSIINGFLSNSLFPKPFGFSPIKTIHYFLQFIKSIPNHLGIFNKMDLPSEFLYNDPYNYCQPVMNDNSSTVDTVEDDNDEIMDDFSSSGGSDSGIGSGPITMAQKYTIQYNMDYTHTYCCNFCNYWTKKQTTMCMHYAIKHRSTIEKTAKFNGNKLSPTTTYECPHCDEIFPVISKLQQHMKNRHQKENLYVCPYDTCNGQSFKQKSALICHHVRNHMPRQCLYYYDSDTFFKKQYVCISCKKRFTRYAVTYHVGKCAPTSIYQS